MNYSRPPSQLPKYSCTKCGWRGSGYQEVPANPTKSDNTGSCNIKITYCYVIKCPKCGNHLKE